MSVKLYLPLLLLYGLLPLPGVAQRYLLEEEQFTTEDGLSHNAVRSIYEDSRGLIWLVTRYGVNRFDGEAFRTYTTESHGLHGNKLDHVYEDPDGLLWMLSGVNGYVGYHTLGTSNFTLLDALRDRTVPRQDYLPPDLLAALVGSYLYVQLPDRSLYFLTEAGLLVHYRGREDYSIEPVDLPEFLSLSAIYPFGTNGLHLLYHGDNSRERSLVSLHREPNGWKADRPLRERDLPFQSYGTPPRFSGSHWYWSLRQPNGFHYYLWLDDRGRWQPVNVRERFPNLPAGGDHRLELLQDNPRRYWLRQDKDVFLLDSTGRQLAHFPDTRLPDYVFTDRAGHLYTSDLTAGFTRYTLRQSPFRSEGFTGLQHRGIAVDSAGRVYVGLDPLHDDAPGYRSSPARIATRSAAVAAGADGGVWTGDVYFSDKVRRERPFRLHYYDGGSVTPSAVLPIADTLLLRSWSVWVDPRDSFVWNAVTHGRLYRTDPANGKSTLLLPYPDTVGAVPLLVHAYRADPTRKGTWLSTSRGLFLLDENGRLTDSYHSGADAAHRLPATNFHHLHIDADGIFWLATGDGGLLRWERDDSGAAGPGEVRQFTRADGLPSMVLHAVYEDELGYLWISSEDGIVQFHKQSHTVRVHRPAQGTTDHEYNRISHYRHPDGTLYFGGLTGITVFHPNDVHRLQRAPVGPGYITVLDVLSYDPRTNRPRNQVARLEAENEIVIPGTTRNLEVILRAPDLSDRAYLLYARVADWQPEFLPLPDARLRLQGIPDGTYEVIVQARNLAGEVLEERRFTAVSPTPFFRKWWFVLLAVLAAATLLAGVFLLDNRRLRRLVRQRTDLLAAQTEELRQLDELKSRFFANVSHELRTPLTLLLAPIRKLLRRSDLTPETFTSLRRANTSGERLLQLVNNILDLSKLEDDRLEINAEPTPVASLLRRVLGQFHSYAESTGVAIGGEIDLPETLIVSIDREKAETILSNLLTNGIRFTPRGGSVILAANYEVGTGRLTMRVTDTGRGIDDRDLPQLFDRFYQARHGGSLPEGGTGIGLSICHNLTTLLGGSIRVDSTVGRGSTFLVELPAARLSPGTEFRAGAQVRSFSRQSVSTPALPSARLLVVEDNPDLRDYLTELLGVSFELVLAGNGRQALEQLSRLAAAGTLPDLILTDLMMPEMDGQQLLLHLREQPEYARIPTIVLTARAARGDRLQALRTGIDDYLVKPFDEEELLVRINNLLSNARHRSTAVVSLPDEDSNDEVSPEDNWVREVADHVRRHLADPDFGNQQLAELLFVSERTLGRRLKQATGLTTNKFMLEIRLTEARRLRESNGKLTVHELAERVGFRKTTYFAERYRERFGSRPVG